MSTLTRLTTYRGSSSRNLKSAMSYILRQTSVSSIHSNQVNPTSTPTTSPPQQQRRPPPPPNRPPPSRLPPKLHVSSSRVAAASPQPSMMSPFPLTPLIAEVEQEKLAGNNLPDLVKGLIMNIYIRLVFVLRGFLQRPTSRPCCNFKQSNMPSGISRTLTSPRREGGRRRSRRHRTQTLSNLRQSLSGKTLLAWLGLISSLPTDQ